MILIFISSKTNTNTHRETHTDGRHLAICRIHS